MKAARGEKTSRKTDSGYYSSGDEEEVVDVEELLRDSSPLAGDQGQVLQAGSLDIVRWAAFRNCEGFRRRDLPRGEGNDEVGWPPSRLFFFLFYELQLLTL